MLLLYYYYYYYYYYYFYDCYSCLHMTETWQNKPIKVRKSENELNETK